MEPIVMVMRRRRFEWFGHVKRSHETENIRAVDDGGEARWKKNQVAIEGHCQKRQESLEHEGRWLGEVGRSLCKTRYTAQGDGGER